MDIAPMSVSSYVTGKTRFFGASGSKSIRGSFRRAASSRESAQWLAYEVPKQWLRREWRGNYRGQKQIWFLLRLVGRDCDVSLRASCKPEFDAWRWSEYWAPMESVIEFKRDVYQKALEELAAHLGRGSGRL